jgi:hypothetical protein
MKKITFKNEKLDMTPYGGNGLIDFNYKDTMLATLRVNQPAEGLTFTDIELRLKIVDKIEKADKDFILESAQFDYLLNVIKTEKWRVVDKVIINYIKDIENSPEVD